MTPITEQSVESEFNPKATKLAQIENRKHQLMSQLGGDKYKKLYEYIKNARIKNVDDPIISAGIDKIVGTDAAAKRLAYSLDEVVFLEI